MRKKTVGKRKPSSFPPVTVPSFSAIPLLWASPEPGPEPGTEPVDLLDKSICICCDNKGEGEEGVLVCHESGCPISVHANCIGSEPKFDGSGNFYCPYCWYKRAVDTCQQLREKALAAKKALSRFLDTDARADSAGARASAAAQDAESESESEENKDGDESKVSLYASRCSVSETNDSESNVESMTVRKRKDASAKNSLFQQEHEHCNAEGKVARDVNEEEVTSFRSLRKLQRSPGKMMKRFSLTGKRKRLFWTNEEERVLKAGVLKFSTENQKIPWKKILEFGCGVFDKTRTPIDLKDKWKNIISKKG